MSRPFVPTQHDYVRYFLTYDNVRYDIEAPDNWAQAHKEISRSPQYSGMVVTLTDDIIFSGRSATMIRTWEQNDGVLTKIHLSEYEKDMTTDEWELAFSGDLDLSVWSVHENTVKTRVNSNSLTKKLQSRYQTEIDYDNENDLDGNPHQLGSMPYDTMRMGARDITGDTILSIGSEYDSTGANSGANACILFTDRNEGYFGDVPRTYEVARERLAVPADADNLFFYNQQDLEVPLSLDFRWQAHFPLNGGEGGGDTIRIRLMVYDIVETATTVDLINDPLESEDWFEYTFGPGENATLNYTATRNVIVKQKQGLALVYMQSFGSVSSGWEYTTLIGELAISGPVRGSVTVNDCVSAFNLFERSIQLIGGDRLVSEHLSESDLYMSTGYMFRNVPVSPFVFTLEKLYNSFDAFQPIGLQVDNNTVTVERREYFYQNFLAIDFGEEVSNVTFNFDKEQAYSEINIGFESSNFSADAAAKEYNVKSIWVSPINLYKKEVSFVSNIQASSNVIETLRRVQYQEDTERTYTRRGDATLFAIDAYDTGAGYLEPRPWSMDFAVIPTGVLLADDQFNYRLTPMNRLKKIAQWINFGYTKFTTRSLTFSSSTGATNLHTQPTDGVLNGEEDSFIINELPPAWYEAKTCTFEIPPQNLYKTLREKYDGVPKMYGLVRFEHEGRGVLGYINSYKAETFELEIQIKKIDSISGSTITTN